jgi:hypothetical protein
VDGQVQVQPLVDSLNRSRTGLNLDRTVDQEGQMVLGFAKNGKPINHFWCRVTIDNDKFLLEIAISGYPMSQMKMY